MLVISKYMEVWKDESRHHDGSAVTRGTDGCWMTNPNVLGDHKGATETVHASQCMSMG